MPTRVRVNPRYGRPQGVIDSGAAAEVPWNSLVVPGFAAAAIVAVIVLQRRDEILPGASPDVPAQHSRRVDFEQSHVEKLGKEDPEAENRIGLSEIRFDQIRASEGPDPGTIESISAKACTTTIV
jgi:hypothetical protein